MKALEWKVFMEVRRCVRGFCLLWGAVGSSVLRAGGRILRCQGEEKEERILPFLRGEQVSGGTYVTCLGRGFPGEEEAPNPRGTG